MNVSSYSKLTTTPEQHLGLLQFANDLSEKNPSGSLNDLLAANITVAGAPFSQVKHLRSLEDMSDEWNLASSASTMRELNMDGEAVSDDLKVKVVQLTDALAGRDPGYALADHTVGYQKMTQDLAKRGVEMSKTAAPSADTERLESPASPSSQFLATSSTVPKAIPAVPKQG